MNIRFHNTLRQELPVSIHKYKTVKVEKAIIPLTYFNISRELGNDYIRYATGDETTGEFINPDSISIPSGFYTVSSYNDAIKDALRLKGYGDRIEIKFLPESGKVNIQVKKPFVVYFDQKLCNLLGVKFQNTNLLTEITGDNPCQFRIHNEYRITCNLVDKSKNLLNGKHSDIITTFAPKGERYGDVREYSSEQKVAINQYDYSYVEVEIKNEKDERIEFNSNFIIDLLLE